MKPLAALIALGLVTACATTPPEAGPADAFFARLLGLCGKAFEGRIVSPPVEADASFTGKRLVMHVRDCSAGTVRVPFHVGEDRSRTWVVSRTGAGIRLKHDHRHRDGNPDALTQYGGDSDSLILTVDGLLRHEFPADQFSKDLFTRRNLSVSSTNIWAMEYTSRGQFVYELRRPGRFFRVEFDLARPVPAPPPPGGAR